MNDQDQLYFGGDIYTVDELRPTAEAVAVRDGRIIAVGSLLECKKALGGNYESIDLKGRALLPGFIDTHMHPLVLIYFDMNIDLRNATSLRELQSEISKAAQKGAAGAWVVALNLEEQKLVEKRLPMRRELDAACADRPVMVVKHDGHMVIANTKAIEAAGISASTPNPDGGVIDRESDGYPSGPFRESAAQLIMSAMPMPDIPLFIAEAKNSFDKLLSRGITSIGAVLQTGDEGPAGKSGSFDVIALNMLLDRVPMNLYCLLITDDIKKIEAARGTPLHQKEIGRRTVGGIKIFSDGSFGSCTAHMFEPYSDQPDKTGFLVHSEDEIYRRMSDAHNAGMQICIHAIGDAANRTCTKLYDRLLKEFPKVDHRHRIEHASQLDEETIREMARLGLIVSTQPMFIHSEKHWLQKRLGPKRTKMTYPFRSMLDGGVKIAGASDAPVESTNVMQAIQCCVTREGFEPQQGITAAEAVRMFTLDAAYSQFEESVKGSITAGKFADMVILSKNPVSTPPDEIKNIKVERTIVGGKAVYINE